MPIVRLPTDVWATYWPNLNRSRYSELGPGDPRVGGGPRPGLWGWRSPTDSGHMGTLLTNRMTDKKDWKHYLPATLLAGGKYGWYLKDKSGNSALLFTSTLELRQMGTRVEYQSSTNVM